MRQDPRKMRKEALVDGEESFCADRLREAVKDAVVEVAVLVI